MSVQADFNLSCRITRSLLIGGQQVSVALDSPGPVGSLTETTDPASQEGWKGSLSVNGDRLIDLTELSLAVSSGGESTELPIDLTGKALLQVKFRTPVGNGNVAIEVSPGDTNGYPIGSRVLEANSADGFFRPNNPNVVGPTSKIIKLHSAAAATIDVLIVAGT